MTKTQKDRVVTESFVRTEIKTVRADIGRLDKRINGLEEKLDRRFDGVIEILGEVVFKTS